MIEIIEGVAYLKDIKSPEQSLEMFSYLKEHPNQELYLIEGANKYGCGLNGELVRIENMLTGTSKNGFCINPFYIVDIKPANAPNFDEFNTVDKNIVYNKTSDLELSVALEQINELTNKLSQAEYALNSMFNERDIFQKQAVEERLILETEIKQLNDKIECLTSEYNQVLERAINSEIKAEDLLVNSENKLDKTDVRELCKALYDLGFDVELGFYGENKINE